MINIAVKMFLNFSAIIQSDIYRHKKNMLKHIESSLKSKVIFIVAYMTASNKNCHILGKQGEIYSDRRRTYSVW